MAKIPKSTIALARALSALLGYHLIIRVRANYFPRSLLAPLVYLVAEPADFIYNFGTLHSIKQRVESN